ncbi:hypothetical protein PaecuDRAFT_3494 [Paenibacillus curdlanolyticus YK9]|uniref:Uncharacterized protein n=1 Tax=Paenibacillus curdlanolyticus YK9 TaxID=717606 RepID=E0ICZ2_9BACL|nr:hypothetical protein [Paenibacillus curdlanolyticus]EFM09447.1 hypothetical protein PaecuDRAFT_3494 [Paenibacillus curdlanolyticus YK9]
MNRSIYQFVIFILGIELIVLGTLEKIIIYGVKANNIGDSYQLFIQAVPSRIWNITNYTIAGGVLLSVIGALWFVVGLIKESRNAG